MAQNVSENHDRLSELFVSQTIFFLVEPQKQYVEAKVLSLPKNMFWSIEVEIIAWHGNEALRIHAGQCIPYTAHFITERLISRDEYDRNSPENILQSHIRQEVDTVFESASLGLKTVVYEYITLIESIQKIMTDINDILNNKPTVLDQFPYYIRLKILGQFYQLENFLEKLAELQQFGIHAWILEVSYENLGRYLDYLSQKYSIPRKKYYIQA